MPRLKCLSRLNILGSASRANTAFAIERTETYTVYGNYKACTASVRVRAAPSIQAVVCRVCVIIQTLARYILMDARTSCTRKPDYCDQRPSPRSDGDPRLTVSVQNAPSFDSVANRKIDSGIRRYAQQRLLVTGR